MSEVIFEMKIVEKAPVINNKEPTMPLDLRECFFDKMLRVIPGKSNEN